MVEQEDYESAATCRKNYVNAERMNKRTLKDILKEMCMEVSYCTVYYVVYPVC